MHKALLVVFLLKIIPRRAESERRLYAKKTASFWRIVSTAERGAGRERCRDCLSTSLCEEVQKQTAQGQLPRWLVLKFYALAVINKDSAAIKTKRRLNIHNTTRCWIISGF